MSVGAAARTFSAHAAGYDGPRRRLLPFFDEFYGTVVDVLALQQTPPRRILDLGAGTGLLTEVVLAGFPEAEVELLDFSAEMLDGAKQRVGDRAAGYHLQDFAAPLPPGPFDAIVSAVAIHHVSDEAKRQLFAACAAALPAGGVFVNLEQVSAPTPRLSRIYEVEWERHCRELGATDEDLAGAAERMTHDICADTESQLSWLRAAGFAEADCVFKAWRFAVLAAWKAPA